MELIIALVTIVPATGALVLGIAGFVRTANLQELQRHREEQDEWVERERLVAAQKADAQAVGLTYLQASLDAQQKELTRQEGRIGELTSKVADLNRQLGEAEISRRRYELEITDLQYKLQIAQARIEELTKNG